MSELNAVKFRAILVVWTLTIWGSRLRNIQADDELDGLDRLLALGVAYVLLSAATVAGAAILRQSPWQVYPLGALVVLGILRWTIRGPVILISDEWETSFKVVHTVLWLVTVALSMLAWREHRRSRLASSS